MAFEAFRQRIGSIIGGFDAAQAHPSGRLGGVVAPAQVETCSPELLQEAAEAARSRGVPITVVRCLHPATRYRLGSRFRADGNPVAG